MSYEYQSNRKVANYHRSKEPQYSRHCFSVSQQVLGWNPIGLALWSDLSSDMSFESEKDSHITVNGELYPWRPHYEVEDKKNVGAYEDYKAVGSRREQEQ